MNRALRMLVTVVIVIALGTGLAFLIIWAVGERTSLPFADKCVARVDNHEVKLSPGQAQHAATIAAVGQARGLPARAVTIALATAYQESDISNINYGDRDSLGIFQQRPSQGWGTPEEIMDPVYATNAFYDVLVTIPDYRNMDINDAAQKVQRSGHPNGYAKHEQSARVLASALTGHSRAAFHCEFRAESLSEETMGEDGLTARARTLRDSLRERFDDLEIGGYEPGGVTSGHIQGSTHYDGRALDIFFRPHTKPVAKRSGWAMAHWLVSQAQELGIATIIYDDKIWSQRRSREGWRPYQHPSGDTKNATLRHLDHVHVDVAKGS